MTGLCDSCAYKLKIAYQQTNGNDDVCHYSTCTVLTSLPGVKKFANETFCGIFPLVLECTHYKEKTTSN